MTGHHHRSDQWTLVAQAFGEEKLKLVVTPIHPPPPLGDIKVLSILRSHFTKRTFKEGRITRRSKDQSNKRSTNAKTVTNSPVMNRCIVKDEDNQMEKPCLALVEEGVIESLNKSTSND
jgi:hypothetical protein